MNAIIKKKNLYPIFWFLQGMLCFLISQPLLRIPILNWLQTTTSFSIFQISYPIIFMILLSFSAGIFEEGFRFIFKKFLLRPKDPIFLQPIIFGLGHGLMEVFIIFIPNMGQMISMGTMPIAIIERLIAIIAHISLSVIIWNGFIKDKKSIYLGLAILAHGLFNTVGIITLSMGLNIWLVEGILGVFAFMGMAYTIYSKSFYKEGTL